MQTKTTSSSRVKLAHMGDCPRTGTVPKAVLLDISGRKVLDLHSGANDVSRLAPGVYFVLEAQTRTVRKVVLTD